MSNKDLVVGRVLEAPSGKKFTIALLKGGAVFFKESMEQPLSSGVVLKAFKTV